MQICKTFLKLFLEKFCQKFVAENNKKTVIQKSSGISRLCGKFYEYVDESWLFVFRCSHFAFGGLEFTHPRGQVNIHACASARSRARRVFASLAHAVNIEATGAPSFCWLALKWYLSHLAAKTIRRTTVNTKQITIERQNADLSSEIHNSIFIL